MLNAVALVLVAKFFATCGRRGIVSRIGRRPVAVPKGVEIAIAGKRLTAKGPLGEVSVVIPVGVTVNAEADQVVLAPESTSPAGAWGLARTLVSNAVEGVSKEFEKRLFIVGVGYRAETNGPQLTLNVGFSHPVVIESKKGVSFVVEPATTMPGKKDNYPAIPVVVKGIDKEAVGDIAAKVRATRPPEPYLWKGIRYQGERMRTDKAGKTAK
jgi:large subunit ribosomal protein L6